MNPLEKLRNCRCQKNLRQMRKMAFSKPDYIDRSNSKWVALMSCKNFTDFEGDSDEVALKTGI